MSRAAAVLAGALLLPACTADDTRPPAPTSAPSAQVAAPPVWLCHPDLDGSVCEGSLDAVAVTASGQAADPFDPAGAPAVDCFYVYPTVSRAPSDSAPREREPAVVAAVRAQAARFGEVCELFVPAYRQVTVGALSRGRFLAPELQDRAYADVRDAWRTWLAERGRDRGVVLIGHSQGAMVLARLLDDEVLAEPDVRNRIVSALLIGGNLTTAAGSDVVDRAGDLPACRQVGQVQCVVAYSAFAEPPPQDALFGRTVPGREVVCTDPTRLSGGDGTLHPYFPTDRLGPAGGLAQTLPAPDGEAAFVAYPGAGTATCRVEDGASWLQVTPVPGAPLPSTDRRSGSAWGLHAVDVTIALGDLVEVVRRQAETWRQAG
ncbi:MAG TPA: DUF3089 domain-containing protein [Mycobacteriales bacterium]|nr:DUF3089 domain-containing protein [Mycobacteriales bacterium]